MIHSLKYLTCLLCLAGFVLFADFSAEAREDLEKVTIQLDWVFQYQYAGFIAAKEKGYYKAAGLDVELKQYQPGVDTIADLTSQKVNYGISNSSIVIKKGKVIPIVLLATYLQQSPLIFVCSPDIKHPRDFVGRRIMGTTDELLHSSLGLLLGHFNIDDRNATIVEHTFHIDDFVNKKVDVMSAFRSNQLYELDRRGIKYTIIDPAEYGFYMSAVNLFSSQNEVLEYPERARKIIDASNRGWQYALDNTAEIIDLIYEKYSPGKSREALAFEAEITRKMMLLDLFPVGQVNRELSERALKQLQQSKLLSTDESLGSFLFDDIINKFNRDLVWTTAERLYLEKKKKITMCVDPDWMPFERIDEQGQHIGLAADILAILQDRSGLKLEPVLTRNWLESLEFAKARKCDILSLAMETPARKHYMDFTAPYIAFPFVIATRTEELFVERLDDVIDKPLAMVKGYAYSEIIKNRYPDMNLVEVDSIMEGLKLLRSGKVYGFLDTLATIAYAIQKEGMVDIKISGKFKDTWMLSVGTRNDEPLLHSIMDKALKTISEKEKRDIYNSWFSIRFEEGTDYSLIYKTVAVFLLFALLLFYHQTQLRKNNKMLVKLSRTDALTGVFNRMKLDELLLYHHTAYKRYGHHFSVIMVDIDKFKSINDEFGHQAGDKVLIRVTEIIGANIRQTDSFGRWGGEEFLILSPNTYLAGAAKQSENIRSMIEKEDFGLNRPVTISLGVAEMKPDEEVFSVISRADKALYVAKDKGRNRVEVLD